MTELALSLLGLAAMLTVARGIVSHTDPPCGRRGPRPPAGAAAAGRFHLLLCRLGQHRPETVVVQRFPAMFLELRKTSCLRCSREL